MQSIVLNRRWKAFLSTTLQDTEEERIVEERPVEEPRRE
jgi:hypothetical protein